MKQDIERIFNARIKYKFGRIESVYKMLDSHERKNVVIHNCCEQIKIAEKKTFSIKFDKEKYTSLVKSIADMFAGVAIKNAEEGILSTARKQQMVNEHQRKADIKSLVDEL